MKPFDITSFREKYLEELADIEHQRWADWQRHCHSKIISDPDFRIGAKGNECIQRWERQINSPYKDLSEKEKQSDRREVERYLPIIEKFILSAISEAEKRGREEGLRIALEAVENIKSVGEGVDKWVLNACREAIESKIKKQ